MNQNSFFPGANQANNFSGTPIYSNSGIIPNQQNVPTMAGDFPLEQSYIENILRLNKGKKVDVYMTFPDSTEWRDLKFSGIIGYICENYNDFYSEMIAAFKDSDKPDNEDVHRTAIQDVLDA